MPYSGPAMRKPLATQIAELRCGIVPTDRNALIPGLKQARLWANNEKENILTLLHNPHITHVLRSTTRSLAHFVLTCWFPGTPLSQRYYINTSMAYNVGLWVIGGEEEAIHEKLRAEPSGSYRVWIRPNKKFPMAVIVRTGDTFLTVPIRELEVPYVDIHQTVAEAHLHYLKQQNLFLRLNDLTFQGLEREPALRFRCRYHPTDKDKLQVLFMTRTIKGDLVTPRQYKQFNIPKDQNILQSIERLKKPSSQLQMLSDQRYVVANKATAIKALSKPGERPGSCRLYRDSGTSAAMLIRQNEKGRLSHWKIGPEANFWERVKEIIHKSKKQADRSKPG